MCNYSQRVETAVPYLRTCTVTASASALPADVSPPRAVANFAADDMLCSAARSQVPPRLPQYWSQLCPGAASAQLPEPAQGVGFHGVFVRLAVVFIGMALTKKLTC